MRSQVLTSFLSCGVVGLVGLSACGGDDDTVIAEQPSPGDETPGEGNGAPADGPEPETAVVLGVWVRTPDSGNTYLLAGDALPTGAVDLGRALELPDGLVWQSEQAVFFGNFETRTLQKYEVGADYSIQLTGEMSLANYGVDFINQEPLFFSATRAYYVDAVQGQLIVFDPERMVIVADVQVPEFLRDGFVPRVGSRFRVGDRYLAAVAYPNSDFSQVPNDSTVAIFRDDPAQPVQLIRDDRGAAARQSFVDSSGTFYTLADGLGGRLALTGLQELPSPRLLRVLPGESAFDPGYMLDLGALIDTPGLQGLWPVGDTRFAVQAWPRDIDPSRVLDTPGDYSLAPYLDWVLVDAASSAVTPITGIDRSPPYSLVRWRLDGQTYLGRYLPVTEDSGTGELYALRDDASAERVLEAPSGEFWFLGRVPVRSP